MWAGGERGFDTDGGNLYPPSHTILNSLPSGTTYKMETYEEVLESDVALKKQATGNEPGHRTLTIGIAREFVEVIAKSDFGSEQRLFATFYAAIRVSGT